MSRHTPGPWMVLPDVDAEGGWIVGTEKHHSVAEVGVQLDDANELANARLIAAAPDLLTALSGYVHAVATGGGTDVAAIMAAIREADNTARTVIAKATGAA